MENMIPDVSLVSLPVPIYLPSPTPSYRLFQPKAVPIPVPVFVPIMIPVTRKTYKNIRDYLQVRFIIEMKKIGKFLFRLNVIFYRMIHLKLHLLCMQKVLYVQKINHNNQQQI
jgi:hypothetical protein